MNKEYEIKSDGTAIIHESIGRKETLTNNTYPILQAQNSIEQVEKLIKDGNEDILDFALTISFLNVGAIIIACIAIRWRFEVSPLWVSMLFYIMAGVLFSKCVLTSKKMVEQIKNQKIIISDLKSELKLTKERLKDLKKTAVELSLEEAQELAKGPTKVEEEENLSKLRETLKTRLEVLINFKKYKKLYEQRMLYKYLLSLGKGKENSLAIIEEVENQVRKRELK